MYIDGSIIRKRFVTCLAVHLKSLLETAADVGGKDFVQLVRTSGLEEKTTASNLTLFVPSDDAVRDFTDSLQEAVSMLLVIQTPHQYKTGHDVFLSSCMLLSLCRFLLGKHVMFSFFIWKDFSILSVFLWFYEQNRLCLLSPHP